MIAMNKVLNRKTPFLWVPTVYFMQGFPGCVIMVMLAIMYKNFGVSNSEITLYTGALVLPWVIKPLWAPLIDVVFTIRWWIYVMEILVGLLFILMAFTLETKDFFIISLTIAWAGAFVSSSHDIASDGFYINQLTPEQQSFFVGLQSASYNVGKIFATGFIIMLCGVLYADSKDYFLSWQICLIVCGVICILFGVYHRVMLDQSRTKVSQPDSTVGGIFENFIDVYKSFLKLEYLWIGVLFLLLFKCSELMISAVLPLFLVDTVASGGLGLDNTFVGFAYGTVAPIAIVFGGILGGYYIYRRGFAKSIYSLFVIVNLPHILYILLASLHIYNHWLVSWISNRSATKFIVPI